MATNQIDLRNADIGTIAVQGVKTFSRKYPKVTGAYVIGLAVIMFGVGFAVDEATKSTYFRQMDRVEEFQYNNMDRVARQMQSAYDHYYQSKGWFSCDYNCNQAYQHYLQKQSEYNQLAIQRDQLLTEAKKTVGIFSEYGVAECRQRFWDAWEHGKAVAKRMSFWDAMMTPMRSRRDEDGIVTLLRLVGQVMMNFTIGLCVNVASFVYNLIWFVRSYEAGPAGALFFVLAVCGAFAVLASFVIGMFVVVGGGGYMVVKYADRQAIQGGRRQHRRVRNNYRYHMD